MADDLLGPDSFVEDRTFTDLDAPGVRFAGKELYRCRFVGAKLAESRFERCSLEACTFDDCDLTRWVPAQTALRGVTFRNTKLLGADFTLAAENPELTFERCSLRYAMLNGLHLRGARFVDCELQDAQLVECDLTEASFPGCDFTNATFTRCTLAAADFSDARGVYFVPRDNGSKGTFVAVETAVLLAQAAGLRVAGYDEAPKRRGKARR